MTLHPHDEQIAFCPVAIDTALSLDLPPLTFDL